MTQIQEQAIELIRQLPDSKIQAIITLAADELQLTKLQIDSHVSRKKQAFAELEKIQLDFPDDFDAELERKKSLEEKYGRLD
ncbi:hypothetical protein [Ruminococcus sp.]